MEKPKRYKRFESEYPSAAEAYENLGKQIHSCGPLDSKTRALIKIAISTGAGLEGALHSHTRKAVEAGCTKEEIRHAIMLSIPTIGLPSAMAAMSWADDILDK